MKKTAVSFLCIVLLLTTFSSAYAVWPFSKPTSTPAPLPEEQVNCLTDCYFFYDNASNKYFLLFALLDKTNNPLSPSCTAEVTVKSDVGEVLYSSKRSVTSNDYKFWPLFIDRSLYCTGIQIDANLISPCISGKGTISCHVYKDGYFDFDTFTIDAPSLPKIDPQTLCSLTLPDLPLELTSFSYRKLPDSRILVNNIVYNFESYYGQEHVTLRATFYGERTFSTSSSTVHTFSWKLYDDSGYLVDGGNAHITGTSVGDKFRQNCLNIYNLKPGNYTLELSYYKP